MADLARMIREVQEQSAGLCAQCLHDAIATEAESLDGLTGRLEAAFCARGSAPGSEAAYAEAFTDVMSSLVLISALTTELGKRPALQVPELSLN
jgi:hypothetical protein